MNLTKARLGALYYVKGMPWGGHTKQDYVKKSEIAKGLNHGYDIFIAAFAFLKSDAYR